MCVVGSLNIKCKPGSLNGSIEKGLKVEKIKPKRTDEWEERLTASFVVVIIFVVGIGSMGETFWFACQIHICIHTLNKNQQKLYLSFGYLYT